MLSSETPGCRPPKSCALTAKRRLGCDGPLWVSPTRKASLTTVLNGRPVRRASARSRAAISASSVRVVRTS